MAHIPDYNDSSTHIGFPPMILHGAMMSVGLILYIFWHRKHARMAFRAWALFLLGTNFVLFYNAIPDQQLLTHIQVNLLFGLQFLVSTLTICRAWRDLEERYQ